MFVRTLIALLLLSIPFGGVAQAAAEADTNQASYWGNSCTKTEMDGTRATYTAPAGATKVVVKGGTGYIVYDKAPFTNLTAPTNPKNGQTYGISHVIVCTDAKPVQAQTVSSTPAKPGRGAADRPAQTAQTPLATQAAAVSEPEILPEVGPGMNLISVALAVIAGTLAHRRLAIRRYA